MLELFNTASSGIAQRESASEGMVTALGYKTVNMRTGNKNPAGPKPDGEFPSEGEEETAQKDRSVDAVLPAEFREEAKENPPKRVGGTIKLQAS